MKKGLRNLVIVAALGFLMAGAHLMEAMAAGSARISFTDVNCKVGETVTVNMSVHTSDTTLAAFDAVLQYPADYLEFVSCSVPSPGNSSSPGGGTIIVNWYDANGSGNVNCSLKFKALKNGSTAITVASQEISDKDGNTISSSAASSAITIGAEGSASNDASLSALQISPGKMAFSPDKTDYSIQVNNDVAKLAVSAKTKDANAKFVVSNTDLAVGDNTITVKVTAADGKTTKTYTIKVKRKDGSATTTTKASETTKEEESSETEEESGGESGEDITAIVDGQEMRIARSLEGVSLPEGYEVVEYEYDGEKIQAARSLSSDMLLLYLSDKDGENYHFYFYDESEKTFTRLMSIQMGTKLYTVVDLDDGVIIPDHYHSITVEIDGIDFPAWQSNDDLEGIYYLIYAMNWNGEKALYRYDSYEGTMQRADERLLVSEQNAQIAETEPQSIEDLQSKLDEAEGKKQGGFEFPEWGKYVIIGLLVIVILVALVMLAMKNSAERGGRNGNGRGSGSGRRNGSRSSSRDRRPRREEYDDDDDLDEFGEYDDDFEIEYLRPERESRTHRDKTELETPERRTSTKPRQDQPPRQGQTHHQKQYTQQAKEAEEGDPLPKDLGSSDLGKMLNDLDHSGDDDFEIFDL